MSRVHRPSRCGNALCSRLARDRLAHGRDLDPRIKQLVQVRHLGSIMSISVRFSLLLSGSARAMASIIGALPAQHGVRTAFLVDITTKRELSTGSRARPIAVYASGVCA